MIGVIEKEKYFSITQEYYIHIPRHLVYLCNRADYLEKFTEKFNKYASNILLDEIEKNLSNMEEENRKRLSKIFWYLKN